MNHFFIFLLLRMILTSEGTKTRRIFSVENKKEAPVLAPKQIISAKKKLN